MKFIVLLFAFIVFCNAAPAPEPGPKPAPAPAPKPNPGFLIPANPTYITSPIVSYSHYFKSPFHAPISPYVYNLGYAPAYSYSTYPYYVPLHYI